MAYPTRNSSTAQTVSTLRRSRAQRSWPKADKTSMARLRAARMQSLGDERGFTLPELLVSVVVFGFVMTAVLSMLDTTAKLSTNDQERPAAINEARTGIRLDGPRAAAGVSGGLGLAEPDGGARPPERRR